MFFIQVPEMPYVFVTEHVRDLIDLAVFPEQACRLLHFFGGQIGNEGPPCFLFEERAEIRRA